MAELFTKQAKQYAESRPRYPPELIQFIASKTPLHDLAWDVGTGTGQAALSLAGIYKNVVATDTSSKQLELTKTLPNIRYQVTPPTMSLSEVEQLVATQGSVDLVTIAQAMHWFDMPKFYQQVKSVLKKPHGVIAAWCYTVPRVNQHLDEVFHPFYTVDSDPYWEPQRQFVNDKYATIEFPFEPVDGTDNTGPFEFAIEKQMDFDQYITFLRSWSTYEATKDKGIELLTNDVMKRFKSAWDEDGRDQKVVRFPVYLRIGKVGSNF